MKFKKWKNRLIVIFVLNWGYVNFLLLEVANDWLFGLICTRIVPSLNEYLTWPPKLLHKVAWQKTDPTQGWLPVSSTCFLMWENTDSRDPGTQWSYSNILYKGHISLMGKSRLIRRSQWQSPHWNPHVPTYTYTLSQEKWEKITMYTGAYAHAPFQIVSISHLTEQFSKVKSSGRYENYLFSLSGFT